MVLSVFLKIIIVHLFYSEKKLTQASDTVQLDSNAGLSNVLWFNIYIYITRTWFSEIGREVSKERFVRGFQAPDFDQYDDLPPTLHPAHHGISFVLKFSRSFSLTPKRAGENRVTAYDRRWTSGADIRTTTPDPVLFYASVRTTTTTTFAATTAVSVTELVYLTNMRPYKQTRAPDELEDRAAKHADPVATPNVYRGRPTFKWLSQNHLTLQSRANQMDGSTAIQKRPTTVNYDRDRTANTWHPWINGAKQCFDKRRKPEENQRRPIVSVPSGLYANWFQWPRGTQHERMEVVRVPICRYGRSKAPRTDKTYHRQCNGAKYKIGAFLLLIISNNECMN